MEPDRGPQPRFGTWGGSIQQLSLQARRLSLRLEHVRFHGRGPAAPARERAPARTPPITRTIDPREPLRSTRPVRRGSRAPRRRRLGRAHRPGAAPCAPGPGRAECRRLHPRRSRVGQGQDPPRGGARRPAERPRHRLLEPRPRGRHPGVRARRRGRHPRHRLGPPRRSGRLAPAPARPDLARSTHGLRHRLPRPPAGRLPRGAADPARATRHGARPDGRARRRSGLLRRRPDGQRAGPPAQRGHQPAARGDRAAHRVRVDRGGGRPARGRWRERPRRAGGDLPHRVGHPDEHLRAQPGHAPRARPRRRLLPAHDEPLPRGARETPDRRHPRRQLRGQGRGGPDDGRDGRAGGLLQRPDGPARPARPRPVRVHDPALGRHRRGGRRRPGGRGRAHAPPRDPRPRRPASRPVRDPPGPGPAARRRPVGPPRALGHAPADRRPRPDPRVPAPPRFAVRARPVQRPRLEHPPAVGPVAGRLRSTAHRVRRGRVRAADPGHPHDRRRRPRPRPTSPDCSTTRGGSPRIRG